MIEACSKLDLVYMDLWMVFKDIGVKVRVDAGMNFSQRFVVKCEIRICRTNI